MIKLRRHSTTKRAAEAKRKPKTQAQLDFIAAIEASERAEKPLATCQDCGARFVFTQSELDAEVCDPCLDA